MGNTKKLNSKTRAAAVFSSAVVSVGINASCQNINATLNDKIDPWKKHVCASNIDDAPQTISQSPSVSEETAIHTIITTSGSALVSPSASPSPSPSPSPAPPLTS